MSRMIRLRGAVLAVAVAGALGYGGAQAVASPAKNAATFRGCTQDSCDRKCMTQYGVPGFCEPRGCRCFI